MQGEWTPYTELSPENLARAVWDALATQFNDAGTMGNKLNTASSGGGGSGPSAEVIAVAVKNAIQAELDRIDVSISSRLSTSNYVALK